MQNKIVFVANQNNFITCFSSLNYMALQASLIKCWCWSR